MCQLPWDALISWHSSILLEESMQGNKKMCTPHSHKWNVLNICINSVCVRYMLTTSTVAVNVVSFIKLLLIFLWLFQLIFFFFY